MEEFYADETMNEFEEDEVAGQDWDGETMQAEFDTLSEDETLEAMEDGTTDSLAYLMEEFNGTGHLQSTAVELIADEEESADLYPDNDELTLEERPEEGGESFFSEEELLVLEEGQFGELAWEESEVFVEGELTTDGISKAMRLNSQYAKKLGWERYRDRIESFLITWLC